MTLTKNELEIMDVLWGAGKPLSRAEIIGYSDDKSWKDSSIHILLNSLLEKGALEEAGFVKCGKSYGRLYAPKVSCEEYHISTLSSTKTVPNVPKLFSALLELDSVNASVLSEMEEIIRAKKAGK